MKSFFLFALLIGGSAAFAQTKPVHAYGANLEGFSYPYPVKRLRFESQRQLLSMAYMDIPGRNANGHTVVLLHGKNFCAATWEGVIGPLSAAGYRVVVPDQIGFCKSSKPEQYQYSLHQLAANTRRLTDSLGIHRLIIMGHSMGGMLAFRYALLYPEQVEALVVVNPLGLEDWKAKGVPYQTIDSIYRNQLHTTFESIKNYELHTYYVGQWRPQYDRWVEMLAGMYAGPGHERVAWSQALTSDMIYTQPVVYEFPDIRVPTLLLIGGRDTTAPGKSTASPEVAAQLGHYAELGRRAAEAITHSRLVPFPDLGHAPHIQDPERFNKALLENLQEILKK